MLNRIVIVGASSGIGAALALEMARPGRSIALVARRAAELERVAEQVRARGATALVEPCDAKDTAAVEASWQRLSGAMGGVDALIYASGVMPEVGIDEFNTEKDREMIEVNVVGAMAWLNCGARDFARRGSGTLCGIGSVAGDRGRRPHPAYGASKAALHHYLEALRNRLSLKGIHVVTIKPGPVQTPMIEGRGKMPMTISAEKAAARIAKAVERGENTVYVPGQWWLIMHILQHMPSFIFKRLSI